MKDNKYGALDTKGKIPKPCSFAKASNVIKSLNFLQQLKKIGFPKQDSRKDNLSYDGDLMNVYRSNDAFPGFTTVRQTYYFEKTALSLLIAT